MLTDKEKKKLLKIINRKGGSLVYKRVPALDGSIIESYGMKFRKQYLEFERSKKSLIVYYKGEVVLRNRKAREFVEAAAAAYDTAQAKKRVEIENRALNKLKEALGGENE